MADSTAAKGCVFGYKSGGWVGAWFAVGGMGSVTAHHVQLVVMRRTRVGEDVMGDD